MNRINAWLREYPSTNARLFVSACLCVFYVVTVLLAMIFGREIDDQVVWSLGGFLLILSGLDTAQFGAKRGTSPLAKTRRKPET